MSRQALITLLSPAGRWEEILTILTINKLTTFLSVNNPSLVTGGEYHYRVVKYKVDIGDDNTLPSI